MDSGTKLADHSSRSHRPPDPPEWGEKHAGGDGAPPVLRSQLGLRRLCTNASVTASARSLLPACAPEVT